MKKNSENKQHFPHFKNHNLGQVCEATTCGTHIPYQGAWEPVPATLPLQLPADVMESNRWQAKHLVPATHVMVCMVFMDFTFVPL